MDYESALETARNIAGRIDQPAWVCREPDEHSAGRFFFVRCMAWVAFDAHYNSGNCVAVVLPDGNTFERLNWRQH